MSYFEEFSKLRYKPFTKLNESLKKGDKYKKLKESKTIRKSVSEKTSRNLKEDYRNKKTRKSLTEGILYKNYMYDSLGAIKDMPEEYFGSIIQGVDTVEELLKYLPVRNGEVFLRKGTKLNWVDHDAYYDYYEIEGTPITLGINDAFGDELPLDENGTDDEYDDL